MRSSILTPAGGPSDDGRSDRPRSLKEDRRAQIQIMEIITAGLIMMSALTFISSLTVPTNPTSSHNDQLTNVVTDSLLLMSLAEPVNTSYYSLLDEMLCTDDAKGIATHIADALDPAYSFNIVLTGDTAGQDGWLVYSGGSPTGATVVGHRAVALTGGSISVIGRGAVDLHCGAYDLRVIVWNEPRAEVGS